MRVLVVDDDQDTLDTVSTWLQEWGHEVRALSDSSSALSIALEFMPDIVFIGIGMPEMDGCEVALRLRQHGALDRTFLVAVTGHGRTEDYERIHAAGCDVHLLKPVEVRDLQLLLKRHPQPAPR